MSLREDLFELIKAEPGITPGEMRQSLKLEETHDRCRCAHELTLLFRRGLVTREKANPNTYKYFEAKSMTHHDKVIAIVSNNPGISSAKLGELLADTQLARQCVSNLYKTNRLTRKKVCPLYGRPHWVYYVVGHEEAGPQAEERLYMTVIQAEQTLGVDSKEMNQLIKDGRIRYFGSSGDRKFLVNDVHALRDQMVTDTDAEDGMTIADFIFNILQPGEWMTGFSICEAAAATGMKAASVRRELSNLAAAGRLRRMEWEISGKRRGRRPSAYALPVEQEPAPAPELPVEAPAPAPASAMPTFHVMVMDPAVRLCQLVAHQYAPGTDGHTAAMRCARLIEEYAK